MVSVIIPVYNGSVYIQKIIKSFVLQDDQDFELIFINDGSTDDSLIVLNNARIAYNLRITVIDQQNAGVSSARNAGIESARGDLICFCDVDDEVASGYVSGMRSVLNNNSEVDLVFCRYDIVFNSDKVVNEKNGTGEVIVKDSLHCLEDYLYGRLDTGCWSLMVRKEMLLKSDIRFPVGYKYGEDIHMVWRLIAYSNRVAYLDRYLYHYYLQENSATSKFNDDRLEVYELIKSLDTILESTSPQFAPQYIRYASSKVMWSLTWQASVQYEYKRYKEFLKKHNVRRDMWSLLGFKSPKVSVSSALFLLSPRVFRHMAIRYRKKLVH